MKYKTHDESAAYQRGLNDAWEAARKIANSPGKGGFPELYSIFGSYSSSSVLNGLKAAEAIAKIRAYEASQEIHVGDEVERDGITGVVTNVYEVGDHPKETFVNVLYSGGNSMCSCRAASVKKKKRNFPEVAALLNKMKGDADESD